MSDSLIRLIDHAVLQPAQNEDDVRAACELCLRFETASVCVKPCDVSLAAELLAGSHVLCGTVIGFPHGVNATPSKVAEAKLACQQGARELDMVVNLGLALAGAWQRVEDDIWAVVECAAQFGVITKVILETGLIADDETKRELCRLCDRAGAAFVKTSTGFGMIKQDDGRYLATGATERDIRLMRAACGSNVGVKASGGIRSLADAKRMIAAGANRLGTSATGAIIKELMLAESSPIQGAASDY